MSNLPLAYCDKCFDPIPPGVQRVTAMRQGRVVDLCFECAAKERGYTTPGAVAHLKERYDALIKVVEAAIQWHHAGRALRKKVSGSNMYTFTLVNDELHEKVEAYLASTDDRTDHRLIGLTEKED